MPLLTLDHVSIAFGHLPLLDDVSLQVDVRERVCLIGRNGSGKSTLLKIVSGEAPPDSGTVWRQPNPHVARPVFDVVSEGLGFLGDLVMAYHHAAVAVAEHGTEASLAKLGRLQHELEEKDGWRLEQRGGVGRYRPGSRP